MRSTTARAAEESQQKIEHLENDKTTTASKLSELTHALTASREQLEAERQSLTDADATNEVLAEKLEEAKKSLEHEEAKVKAALNKQEELRKDSEHQNAAASVQSLQQSVLMSALEQRVQDLSREVADLQKQRAECAAREAEVLAIFTRTAHARQETPQSTKAVKDATTDKSESTNFQRKIDEASTPASTSANQALMLLPAASQGASQQSEQSGNKRSLSPVPVEADPRKRRRYSRGSPPPWARRVSHGSTGESC